jgi:hypothetical protein
MMLVAAPVLRLLRDHLRRRHLLRGVVLGDLADRDADHEADHHRQVDVPVAVDLTVPPISAGCRLHDHRDDRAADQRERGRDQAAEQGRRQLALVVRLDAERAEEAGEDADAASTIG